MKKWISIGIVFVLITLLLFGLHLIQYNEIDDYMIQEMLAGYYGQSDCHVLYVHVWLANLFVFLFRLFHSLNWYALFLVGSQLIIFTILTYRFLQKQKHSRLRYLVLFLFIVPVYVLITLKLQYTIVAYCYLLLSLVYQLSYYTFRRKSDFVILMITFVLALLIRHLVFISYLFFAIGIGIYEIMRHHQAKRRLSTLRMFIGINLVLFMVYGILFFFHWQGYQDERKSYYYQYDKERSILNDTAYFKETNQITDQVGWSENDLRLFHLFSAGDEMVFSHDRVASINLMNQEMNGISRFLHFDVISFFHSIFENSKQFFALCFLLPSTYLLLIYLFLCLTLKASPKKKFWLLFPGILQFLLFIVLGRDVFRVVYPVLFIPAFLLLLNSRLSSKLLLSHITIHIVLVFLLLAQSLSYAFFTISDTWENIEYNEATYNKLITYLNRHPENAYVYPTRALQLRYYQTNLFTTSPKGILQNIHPLGSWSMYDSKYYRFKEKYEIDGLYSSLLTHDHYYLIDHQNLSHLAMISTFLKEHYAKDKEIEFQEITSIDYLTIYQLNVKN